MRLSPSLIWVISGLKGTWDNSTRSWSIEIPRGAVGTVDGLVPVRALDTGRSRLPQPPGERVNYAPHQAEASVGVNVQGIQFWYQILAIASVILVTGLIVQSIVEGTKYREKQKVTTQRH